MRGAGTAGGAAGGHISGTGGRGVNVSRREALRHGCLQVIVCRLEGRKLSSRRRACPRPSDAGREPRPQWRRDDPARARPRGPTVRARRYCVATDLLSCLYPRPSQPPVLAPPSSVIPHASFLLLHFGHSLAHSHVHLCAVLLPRPGRLGADRGRGERGRARLLPAGRDGRVRVQGVVLSSKTQSEAGCVLHWSVR